VSDGVRACVLDTDVVIGALDRADAHHGAATALLLRLIADGVPRRMSPINYAEALVRPAERGGALERAVAALEGLGVELVPPSAVVARDAARIRGEGVSLADAFAIAAARQVGGVVASFDRRVQRAARAVGVAVVPGG
jgi:predicted nucleic acid-binding protein